MAAAAKLKNKLLMPKATAVWLIENTKLTFKQIAEFAQITEIEVEALANEDIGRGLVGRNPIENGELTQDEILQSEADTSRRLKAAKRDLPPVKLRAKGPRYTPVSKRADKPDAIAYILKNNPEIRDSQICKLVGTTKPTINSVRDRTHPNSANIRQRHPAEAGLCTWQEYENAVRRALKAAGKDPDKIKAEKEAAQQQAAEQQQQAENPLSSSAFDFSNFLKSSTTPSSSGEEQQ
ncbi:MAG: DUF1013 domain-containing protein [Alphaproteobacteria bacterium]|nr:DUF1013 domain-containing protein [Alphaproteobacteria bacterium]